MIKNSVMVIQDKGAKLSVAQLAEAIYEGTAHVQNLAEKLARHHGKAGALTFYSMMGPDVQNFYMHIAQQLIDHASKWEANNGSSCMLNTEEAERLTLLPVHPEFYANNPAYERAKAERRRQISAYDFTPEHDDKYTKRELHAAAYCYLTTHVMDVAPEAWPFPDRWDPSWNGHRLGMIKQLTKAAALFLAELERLERAGNPITELRETRYLFNYTLNLLNDAIEPPDVNGILNPSPFLKN